MGDIAAPVEASSSPKSAETEELTRLFDIYRIANLNIRYYGSRAEKYQERGRNLSLVAALCSFTAVIVLALPVDEKILSPLRLTAAVLAALATLLTVISPLLGWRAQSLDDLEPDAKLIRSEYDKVLKALPSDYLWKHF